MAGRAKPSLKAVRDSLPPSGFLFHSVDRKRPDVVAGVRRPLLLRRPLQRSGKFRLSALAPYPSVLFGFGSGPLRVRLWRSSPRFVPGAPLSGQAGRHGSRSCGLALALGKQIDRFAAMCSLSESCGTSRSFGRNWRSTKRRSILFRIESDFGDS